jgi:hypothetical protein
LFSTDRNEEPAVDEMEQPIQGSLGVLQLSGLMKSKLSISVRKKLSRKVGTSLGVDIVAAGMPAHLSAHWT